MDFDAKGIKWKVKLWSLRRLKSNLFQKFNFQFCKNGGEKSFTTYLLSKLDVWFCDRL